MDKSIPDLFGIIRPIKLFGSVTDDAIYFIYSFYQVSWSCYCHAAYVY